MTLQEMKIDIGWNELSGRAKFITQGDGLIFAVSEDDGLSVRKADLVGDNWNPMHGRLKNMSICNGTIVGVSPGNNVFGMYGVENIGLGVQDKEWHELNGRLTTVSVGPEHQLWGTTEAGDVVYSASASVNQVAWQAVDGRLAQICCDPMTGQVVGVSDGFVWLRTGISSENPTGAAWERIPLSFTFVSSCNNELVGVTSNNEVWLLRSGKLMQLAGEDLKQVMLAPGGQMVGVTPHGACVVSRISTHIDFRGAIAFLAEWSPNEAEHLTTHYDEIIHYIEAGENPPADSPLMSLQLSYKADAVEYKSVDAEVSPCTMAIVGAVVQAALFALSLVGLRISNTERLTRALLQELGEDTLRGFLRSIHNINSATSALGKAKALFSFLHEIYSTGGFQVIFKTVKDEMSVWEWIETGVMATAQIVAWFATDGVAFIAEATLLIMSAVQLTEAIVNVVKTCG